MKHSFKKLTLALLPALLAGCGSLATAPEQPGKELSFIVIGDIHYGIKRVPSAERMRLLRADMKQKNIKPDLICHKAEKRH